MRLATLLGSLLLAADLHAGPPDVVVTDFEGGTYAPWTVEGKAFGDKPAKGTLPNQMPVTGHHGQYLANSYVGGDDATGKLTSPAFKVERDFLNFLIGGGKFPGKTCVNLLVGGKVVRTATGPNGVPGGSEELTAASWDVKEFRGQEATIQIVDDKTGGWGHICADYFVQSDKKTAVELVDRTRELEVTKPYLMFPIANAAKPVRMTVAVGGKAIHEFDINLAVDKIDWWARMEVPASVGKTAKLTAKKVRADAKGFDLVMASDDPSLRFAQPQYDETLRPQLRFSQLCGWNNDPNGMVYHDGEYHLFWQSNPFGPQWANMYWGHAVSKDLVHWQELPYALYPWTMAKEHCFSGSANIDGHNTGGFGAGAMVATFTDTKAGEALAVSGDRGRTWKYLADNPIIPQRKSEGRDPKLVWYEPGKHWVIAVYTKTGGKDYIEFYTSPDLKMWQKASQLEGYFECPELFELPVDGDATKKKWVVYAADAKYAVGTFDGKTFTPDHPDKHQVHYGDFYAPQCFSRAPGGRVIQVGWARVSMPDMPFNQGFSLPIELRLKTTPQGVRMFAEPVQELVSLRGKAEVVSGPVTAGKSLKAKAPGQLLDMVLVVEPGTAKKVRLTFGGNTLAYNAADQTLNGMPLPMKDGAVTVRVVVDRPMYEVVGGGGAVYQTAARTDGGKPIDAVQVSAVGGTANVKSLTIYPMASIWKK